MSPDERKERVIHTRIPAGLEEQIKRLAGSLRVPVSNLVRNMLEDAIDVTRRVRDRVPHPDPPYSVEDHSVDLEEVFGWQSFTLNISASCARCAQPLQAGDPAFLGLTDRPHHPRVFICPGCLPRPGEGSVGTG